MLISLKLWRSEQNFASSRKVPSQFACDRRTLFQVAITVLSSPDVAVVTSSPGLGVVYPPSRLDLHPKTLSGIKTRLLQSVQNWFLVGKLQFLAYTIVLLSTVIQLGSMSSSNSKSLIIMIDVKYIDRVTWDSKLGEQLRALRGRTSRRKLSDKTSALGRRVSQKYLYQLEKPNSSINRFKSNHLTVSLDIIQVLAKALEFELTDIFTKSISSSNSKSFIMIDVKYIYRVRRDSELGEQLRALRGKTSSRKLSDKTSALGRRVPREYILQLEKPNLSINHLKGDHLSVSLDIIQVLAKALEVELTDIFTKSAIIFQ